MNILKNACGKLHHHRRIDVDYQNNKKSWTNGTIETQKHNKQVSFSRIKKEL